MVRRNVEPSINAISALIVVATSVLLYVSDRLSRRNEPSHA
jgi:ABC-type spermidine/putrescine transport system permease subunit II